MKKIRIYLILLLEFPVLLQAQYIGGIGNGDASVGLTNAHISVHKIEMELPTKYELYQNYPNPFNPTTNIRFQIPKNSFVTLRIYDILGKEITTLIKEKLNAGGYEIQFSINQYTNYQFTSGVYFYTLETNEFSETRKMLMIK
jgi:hypothetical protein